MGCNGVSLLLLRRAQELEKAIFNEEVINARHDWGTRYLEWTSKAFTLDR